VKKEKDKEKNNNDGTREINNLKKGQKHKRKQRNKELNKQKNNEKQSELKFSKFDASRQARQCCSLWNAVRCRAHKPLICSAKLFAAPEPATTPLHTAQLREVRSVPINSAGSYQIRLPAQDCPSSCRVRNCTQVHKYSFFMFRSVRKIAKSDY
jgi:hypothetical protein